MEVNLEEESCPPKPPRYNAYLYLLRVYFDCDLIICNKKPRSFIGNGVFNGQHLFPSSIAIQDGSIYSLSYLLASLSRFSFQIHYFHEDVQSTTFRKYASTG
jgi:hypothetical protein